MEKVLVFFLILNLCGILAEDIPFDDTPELAEFRKGNRLFSGKIYQEIIKTQKGNFITSPFSVEVILALTNEGASGETSKELQKGLNFPESKEITQNALKYIIPQLQRSDADIKLLSANKIYVAKDANLQHNFTTVANNIYQAGVENIDFSSGEQTAKTINKWVEGQTNSKIQDLIKPQYLNEDTKLILVNALYFSGKWENTFEKDETYKEKFYRTKENVDNVDMMYQNDFFKYYENEKLNTKFVELPYEGGNVSLVIALPNEIDGLSKLEANIEQVLEPQPLFNYQKLDLKVPKFEIGNEIQMKEVLEELGIKKLFTREADLSGLLSNSDHLCVDKVIQKAFIKLNEDGTEAAASTGVKIQLRSGRYGTFPFYADHPFLYYIQDHGIILFVGSVKTA